MFQQQHYNAIAKLFRENFPGGEWDHSYPKKQREKLLLQRATLTDLALMFATYFEGDNDRFDPIRFLDACSPDPEIYPLSELWEDHV